MFIYLFILFITLLLIKYFKKFNHFRSRGIPGSIPSPLSGIELLFKDTSRLNLEQRKKYGKIYGTYLVNVPLIVVGDPEIAKQITVKEWSNFTDSNPIKFEFKYIKDTFILKKGMEWKNERALVSPVFTTKKIKDIFVHFQKASKPFFENIENLIKEGKQDEINIKDLLKGYSLDVIAKFVYALELNSAKDHDHPFVRNVRKLLDVNDSFVNILFSLLPLKLIKLFDIQFVDKEAIEFIANTTRYLIKQRTESKEEYNDFLDLLLKTIKEKNVEIKEETIIGTCIVFYFAGLETVSLTITNALYCLVLNQEYQQKLYDELIDLYPDKEITYDNIHSSKLLDAVLKESQRLFPALNLIFRIAENPIEIKGLKILKNDVIAIDILSLQNSPDYWTKPNEFRPDRFLENEMKFENDDSMLFLPFGSGPRSCIAARMALIQSKYVLAQIILNYEVYRTIKTNVPPKYIKNFAQSNYKSQFFGFKKRDN